MHWIREEWQLGPVVSRPSLKISFKLNDSVFRIRTKSEPLFEITGVRVLLKIEKTEQGILTGKRKEVPS